MQRTTQILWVPVALVFVIWMVTPVVAWEFTMRGTFTWEYDAYTQLGSNGFFGNYDVDNSDAAPGYGGNRGSAASMNGWFGNEIGQISSGSDMALATMYMRIYPQLRLNKAVRIRGSYRIGSWATPDAATSRGDVVASEYMEGFSPGIQRSFSPGYWNTLWLSAQTPWGIVVVGKRPSPFGCGIMFDAEDNADAAGILLLLPFGPIRMGLNVVPWFLGSPFYFSIADKNATRQFDIGAAILYDAGPFSFGIAGRNWRLRTGPESATFQGNDGADPTGRFAVIPSDTAITDGSLYVKYHNGSVFFNGEIAWGVELTRRQPWLSSDPGILADGSGRSRFASNYVEHLRSMVELGAYRGPAKLSVVWAWIPGPDRRHGVRIDRQSDLRFVSSLSNVSVFRPYSLLLSYTYGGANNSFTVDSRNGYMTDANILAARLDYAIAANVNIFGTVFWAHRVSHGYGQGFMRPEYSAAADRFTGSVQYVEDDQFVNSAPAIPDGDLGYEIDWGLAWRILESYTISATFGIWQPGRWFNFACVDRSVSNWKIPTAANSFGANPNRTVDPVFGMELTLNADF